MSVGPGWPDSTSGGLTGGLTNPSVSDKLSRESRGDEATRDSLVVSRYMESAAARLEKAVLPSGSGLLAMETAYLGNQMVVQVSILRRASDRRKDDGQLTLFTEVS